MPRPPLYRLALSIVLVTAGSLTACGGGGGGDIQEPKPVASVTITAPTTEIQVGQTVQLTATARDADGTALEGRIFEWTSVIGTVASVSPTGLVTGLAQGQSEIRATTEGVTGGIVITVAPPSDPISVGLQEIAVGLDLPTYLTSPPGDDRLFITEKAGVIHLIKGGTLLPTPFLDLTSKVKSDGAEQGLFALAFYPDYASSGRFIVHYIDQVADTRVSLFRVSGDPDRADPASESVVLAADQPDLFYGEFHKGGQILFGPDGMLYIGLGDGRDSASGQSRGDLLASILRIDVSSGAPYTVPADNPFVGVAGARPEVWSYGLRNPWRFTFDRATHDLYIGDVGQGRWEEVNYASAGAGAGRGLNYGWNLMEGRSCFMDQPCNQNGLTLPVLQYGTHVDGCSVIGGYVYRGAAIPRLQGVYFYSDFCGGWVRSFRMEGGIAVEQTDWPELRPEFRPRGFVTSFGEDAAGELYLLTYMPGSEDPIEAGAGRVYKIVPR